MEPYVSIVILNYNGKEYIFDCINSVFKTTGCNFEVILIDNNSTDQSSDYCKEKFPELILIKNEKNLGMAARNLGIKKAQGNYIVLYLYFHTCHFLLVSWVIVCDLLHVVLCTTYCVLGIYCRYNKK